MSGAAFRPPADDPRIGDLEARVAALAAIVAEHDARLPKRRFAVPPHYCTIKEGAALCGYSAPSLYRLARARVVTSIKVGGRRFIDPSTLPAPRE